MAWWLAGTAVSVVLGMPQAVRLWRTRSVAGVHWAPDLIRSSSKAVWVVYALAVSDWLFAGAQVVIVVPSLVTLTLLLRWRALPWTVAVALPAVAVASGLTLVALSAATLLGHLVAASDVVRYLPQVWRTLHAGSLHGVATGTYVVQLAASVSWAGYGWQTGMWPLVWSNALIVPVVAFIHLRVLRDRRDGEASSPAIVDRLS